MVNGTKLIKIVKKYFDAWNAQDITTLESLFSDDVTLTDWDIQVSTKPTVLEANQNIFNSVKNIRAEVIDIGYNDNKVYAELIIHVNDDEELKVLDIITIHSHNETITSISAYKQ